MLAPLAVHVESAPLITSIVPVTPGEVGIGDRIDIYGSGFGDTGGYIKICGLRVPAPLVSHWSAVRIRLEIPTGAHSGSMVVVDQGNVAGDGFEFEVDYLQDITDDFRVSHPQALNVKDAGYFTCAELIENRELREQLGRNGLAQVKDKFAPDTMVNTIERVYEELLQ